MATVEFTITMNCCVSHDEAEEVYVSHCPTLDVYSQGETEADALEAIKSAVAMHVTTAFDFNRLEKVLRTAGFEKATGESVSQDTNRDEGEFVKVELRAGAKQFPIKVPFKLSAPHTQQQYASVG